MPILIRDDKTFQKAHDEYKRFTADDAMMDIMEAREKWRKDNNSRLDTAMKQGLEQGKKEDARRMLEKNFSLEDIVDITGLSEDVIRGLASTK